MSFKLISFDLDDTLWHTAPTLERAEHRTEQWLKTNAPLIYQQFDSDSLRKRRWNLLKERPDLKHHISEWRRLSLQIVCEEVGYSSSDALAISDGAMDCFLTARQDVELFPHAQAMLAELSKRYMLIGLTNGNARLEETVIGGFFEAHLRAETVGESKPGPRMFLEALNIANCTRDECVHVGDDWTNDCEAAAKLGIQPVQAALLGQEPFDGVPCIRQLSELPHLINQLERRTH